MSLAEMSMSFPPCFDVLSEFVKICVDVLSVDVLSVHPLTVSMWIYSMLNEYKNYLKFWTIRCCVDIRLRQISRALYFPRSNGANQLWPVFQLFSAASKRYICSGEKKPLRRMFCETLQRLRWENSTWDKIFRRIASRRRNDLLHSWYIFSDFFIYTVFS